VLVCQPCGITNQENIRVLGDCRKLCAQAISMAMEAIREIRQDFVSLAIEQNLEREQISPLRHHVPSQY